MGPGEAVQPPQVEEVFSLTPAIFTLFPGFPSDAPALDRDEKLEKIIENLDRQHDAVRKNMMFLIERRADELVNKAKKELSTLEDVEFQYQRNTHREEDLKGMIQRLNIPMKADAKPGAYEITEEIFKSARPTFPESDLLVHEDTDIEMGNTHIATQTSIRADLAHDLRDLVMRGASEMESYDSHAENTTRKYRDFLERNKPRIMSSVSTTSSTPPAPAPAQLPQSQSRGFSSNRHLESPMDRESIRRRPENYQDLARR